MDAVNLPSRELYDCDFSPYIKIITADKHEYYVPRELATISGTVRAMLTLPPGHTHELDNWIEIPHMPSHVFSRVVHFFYLKWWWCNRLTTNEIPEFNISRRESLELVLAANFLDC